MILLLLFSFIGGFVTILSPCILPVLPIVLSGSLTGGKRRPLGVITGFIVSFTFFATFSFALARLLGIGTEGLRNVAVILLLVFGVSIFIPKIQLYLENILSRFNFSNRIGTPKSDGFRGGFILGLTLGLIWTPCVGPILASVFTLAATSAVTLDLVLITFSYALGTAIPLFAIAYGGKHVLTTLPFLKKNSQTIQKVFGVLIILTALMIYYNIDRKFQSYIITTFPKYGEGLTKLETNSSVQKELNKLTNRKERIQVDLENPTIKAPNREFEGATEWINTEPLTLEKLRGKVVLIDFWTYTCINCIRTMPYLTTWYEKYKDEGFVIIGVHTPEFEFEKSRKNVLKAMKEFGITYPVVQDNDYNIWNSYENQAWPAHYLIDKNGYIRQVHFGEGKYKETELAIRMLLKEAGSKVKVDGESGLSDLPDNLPLYPRTPETYLGYGRMDRFGSNEPILYDKKSKYSISNPLQSDELGFKGEWLSEEERSTGYKGSQLSLNFRGKEVYLVMRATGEPARIRILLNGKVVTKENSGDDVVDGIVTVTEDKLYRLISLPEIGSGIMTIEFLDNPVEVFAFTFG